MEGYAAVVTGGASGMAFQDYLAAVRGAGLRAESWLKAKHAGVIVVALDAEGQPRVYLPADAPNGGQ